MAALLFLSSLDSKAQLDLGMESLARSFPLVGYLKATGGYSFKFWDNKEKAPFLYGFARPMISARTSTLVNAVEGRLEIYPVSIFAVFVGNETVYRKVKELHTFDCTTIDCRGTISKNYFGGRTALKFKSAFFMAEAKIFNMESNHPNRLFSDELSTLIAGPGADKLQNFVGILGHEINEKYATALLRMENRMKNTNLNSSMTLLMGQIKFDNYAFLVGPGIFHTRSESDVFTVLALWNWKPERGLLLF